MHPMLAPNRKPGVVPHRLLGVILTAFNVFSGLGRFGRVLRAVLHGSGRSGKAFERLLDGLVASLGEVLTVMFCGHYAHGLVAML